MPAASVVLDGIGQKIEKDLLQALTISEENRFRRDFARIQRDQSLLRQRPYKLEALRDQLLKIDCLDGKTQLALFDASDVKHLVYEVQKVASGPNDLTYVVSVLYRKLVHLKELSKSKDRVEWRP
jgi:hypothetical protein